MAVGTLALVGSALLALGLAARYMDDPVVAWVPGAQVFGQVRAPARAPRMASRSAFSLPTRIAGRGRAGGASLFVALAIFSGVTLASSAGLRERSDSIG